MKILISFCFISLYYLQAFSQTNALKVTWGRERKFYYDEKSVPKNYSQVNQIEAKKGEKLYRYITTNNEYEGIIMNVFEKHNKLWSNFLKEENTSNLSNQSLQAAFKNYSQQNQPNLGGVIKSLAPLLYFDFTGKSGTEYILDSITIKTVDFVEYAGGGFFDKEAWYDILLRHKVGSYTYNVDKKLRFTSSGRTLLRFWSDNYYRGMGMAPMGCYMINIIFNFTVNGKKVSVDTKAFKIDV
jgi:hypothetical protein